MGKRSVLLLVSVLIAALGTALIFVYVRTANDRAVQGAQLVKMNVAATKIPVNTTVTNANATTYFKQVEVPKDSVPPDVVGDVLALLGKIVQSDILEGDPIQNARFGDSATVKPAGIQGFGHSLVIADPQRVAPYIKPGSEMAAFYTIGAGSNMVTKVLQAKVRVIAVGGTKADGSAPDSLTAALPQQLVTLDLEQSEVQRFITVESTLGATITLAAIGTKPVDPKLTYKASDLQGQ